MEKKEAITKTPIWRNKKIVPVLIQIIFVILLGTLLYTMIGNMLAGLEQIGLTLGLSYLDLKASFPIAESIISYTPDDPYKKALLVGLLNTLKVSVIGIILASIIGVIVGISRLSSNWLVSRLATVYVEIFRNTPLLVQIFIWYFAVLLPLPKIEEAISFGSVYFTNRGTAIPWFTSYNHSAIWLVLILILLVVSTILFRILLKREETIGKRSFPFLSSVLTFVVGCFLVYLILGNGPANITVPTIDGTSFSGGAVLLPGFLSVLIALSIYTSTYIAEIVRAGIMGVHKGQTEAAKALGLKSSTSLRLVIFPQAIRIIIPPLTSQYLNLIKNSSLAMAVGFQDIVGVGNTVITQTGHTIETILLVIAVYLLFSLTTSLLMNVFNKKFQLVER